MRITFVGIGWEQLSISLLSAIAKRHGHQVNLAFSIALFNDRYNLQIPYLSRLFDDRENVLRMIERQKPDVLAFSAMTCTYQWMLEMARDAKKRLPQVKVIFGGIHPSAVPERVIRQDVVDYICVGEGDMAFPLILQNIARDRDSPLIPNTRYKRTDGRIIRGPQIGFLQDLDSLPFFDKTIWEEYIRIGDIYFTTASRGCPYQCTYCFNSFFAHLPECSAGRYVRHRSVGHMIQELRLAKKRYALRLVDFEDDVFTCDKKWLKDFLEIYRREIRVPFQCLSHPKFIDTEVARWLKEAGCLYVQLGVQSFADDYKTKVLKRHGTQAEVENALDNLRGMTIGAKVDHMLGLPGEPADAQEKARLAYIKHRPYRIQTFWTNFFPGTELLEQAKTQGLITAAEINDIQEGLHTDFYRDTTRIADKEILKKYKTYELIFKLIPLLPRQISQRLTPQTLSALSPGIASLLSFLADIIHGLGKNNPDHWSYARHYLHHLIRFLKIKLCFRTRPLTSPLNDDGGPVYETPTLISQKQEEPYSATPLS